MSNRLSRMIEFAAHISKDFTDPKTTEDRFWEKVDKSGDCWLWTASKLPFGYGRFFCETDHIYAHRFSYILHYGNIPEGLIICHHCDTPACVNPAHLFAGTYKDNAVDREQKGRGGAKGALRGHFHRGRSGYFGVYRDGARWRATIIINSKGHRLGTYVSPIDAARAYDAAAIKHFGEFARLNFPQEA